MHDSVIALPSASSAPSGSECHHVWSHLTESVRAAAGGVELGALLDELGLRSAGDLVFCTAVEVEVAFFFPGRGGVFPYIICVNAKYSGVLKSPKQ